jgi:thiol:disulfide interchange protein
MAIYGLGLIIPAILFAFFGKKILNITKKTGKIFYAVNKIMHYILILSGIYLIFTIKKLEVYDIFIISLFLIVNFFILLKAFFIINEKKDILKWKNILLLISLIMIIFVSINHCSYEVESQNKVNEILGINTPQTYSCNQDITTCSICQRCIYTFSIATLIGLFGIFLVGKKNENNNT